MRVIRRPRAPRALGGSPGRPSVKRGRAGADEVTTDARAPGSTDETGVTVHDDGTGRWPPARPGTTTIDLGRHGTTVTTPAGERRRVSVAEHREDVVRRLLQRGLSPRLLGALLPEFRSLIAQLTEA